MISPNFLRNMQSNVQSDFLTLFAPSFLLDETEELPNSWGTTVYQRDIHGPFVFLRLTSGEVVLMPGEYLERVPLLKVGAKEVEEITVTATPYFPEPAEGVPLVIPVPLDMTDFLNLVKATMPLLFTVVSWFSTLFTLDKLQMVEEVKGLFSRSSLIAAFGPFKITNQGCLDNLMKQELCSPYFLPMMREQMRQLECLPQYAIDYAPLFRSILMETYYYAAHFVTAPSDSLLKILREIEDKHRAKRTPIATAPWVLDAKQLDLVMGRNIYNLQEEVLLKRLSQDFLKELDLKDCYLAGNTVMGLIYSLMRTLPTEGTIYLGSCTSKVQDKHTCSPDTVSEDEDSSSDSEDSLIKSTEEHDTTLTKKGDTLTVHKVMGSHYLCHHYLMAKVNPLVIVTKSPEVVALKHLQTIQKYYPDVTLVSLGKGFVTSGLTREILWLPGTVEDIAYNTHPSCRRWITSDFQIHAAYSSVDRLGCRRPTVEDPILPFPPISGENILTKYSDFKIQEL